MGALNATEAITILNAVFGAALVFVSTLYWTERNAHRTKAEALAKASEALMLRVNALESQLALVNQAVVPISTAFQAILIKELTHYHTPEMDMLLTKIGPPSTLTPVEMERFVQLLEARMIDMDSQISEQERGAATILPVVMVRAAAEYDLFEQAENLRSTLVTVAVARLMDLGVKLPIQRAG